MDDIINYTMENPENTNPNVLRGMLENYNKSDGGGIFYVNITFSEEGSPTADKTFEEIKFAYNSGKYIIAKFGGTFLPLQTLIFSHHDSEGVAGFIFANSRIAWNPPTQKGILYYTEIVHNGLITLDEKEYKIDYAT